jgi:hypothetical protein
LQAEKAGGVNYCEPKAFARMLATTSAKTAII